jgi:hypothetical protein
MVSNNIEDIRIRHGGGGPLGPDKPVISDRAMAVNVYGLSDRIGRGSRHTDIMNRLYQIRRDGGEYY